MNWTGGRLARHSKAGNAKNSKQKQHFARVKQNLQNNTREKPPVKWDILNRVVEERTGACWEARPRSTEDHRIQEGKAQRFHSVTPIGPTNLMIPAKRSSRKREAQDDGDLLVRIKRERFNEDKQPAQLQNQPEPYEHDSIYDATPPQREGKRKHEASRQIDDSKHKEGLSAEERRMRLLEKKDWVGFTTLVPAKVVFNSPSREDNVGRRRVIPRQNRPRFESRNAKYSSPPLRVKAPNLSFAPNSAIGAVPAKSDVRITIGGRIVRPDVSSSTRPCRNDDQPLQRDPIKVKRTSLSSSVMLLDDYRSSPVVTVSSLKERANIAVRDSPLLSGYTSNVAAWDQQKYWKGHGRNKDWESGSVYQKTGSTHESKQPKCGQHTTHDHSNDGMDEIIKISPHLTTMNNQARTNEMKYSSSSASIQHPKPQSSKIFFHFRTSSSGFAESTVAQVGIQKPAVTKSQVLDDETWRTLVAPLEEDGMGDSSLSQWDNENGMVSISPGISALPSDRNHITSHIEDDSDSLSAMERNTDCERISVSPEVDDRQRHQQTPLHNINRSSKIESPGTVSSYLSKDEFDTGSAPRGSRILQTWKGHGGEAGLITPKAITEIQIGKNIPEATTRKFEQCEEPREDPDDAWKRFVFGSEGEQSDQPLQATKLRAFIMSDTQDSSISMISRHSTGAQWSSSPPGNRQSFSKAGGKQSSIYPGTSSHSIAGHIGKCGNSKLKQQVIEGKKFQIHHISDDDGYSSKAIKGTVAASSLDS